ncbi:MAG: TRAP transporter large permease [Alphaproteobacteria bacterium]|nr:TRAP transporter large permease [Alphaproteobacteria bacterium]
MLTLFGWFLGLLAIGLPVALVLGGTAIVYMTTVADLPLRIVPQRLFAGLDRFILMSIPFFVLAGFLMNEAQLTDRLIRFANLLVGRWRGGLAQVNVVTSMFFGGITGAATADTAAIGTILIPAMEKEGYRSDFAAAVTVSSSIVGPLIPPSIPMLVYGIASNASIGALFLAGLTPGVVVGLALLALNRRLLRNFTPTAASFDSTAVGGVGARLREIVRTVRISLIALVMPVIIVGGIVGGVFTPTESSAVAVMYALVVGLAMGTLTGRSIARTMATAVVLTAAIMLIIANANLLGWVLAIEQIPQTVSAGFLSLTESRTVFLLIVVVLLLVIGLFLETSGAIIILVPVLLPAATQYGIDPVHFGVVLVFGLVIGLITPPVGLCLFIGSSIARVPVHTLSRALIPFLAVLIAVYLFFVFVPAASLWLPRLLS